jgi:pSer/pThr/pTyr-binding forkhead associated (FHA) protein
VIAAISTDEALLGLKLAFLVLLYLFVWVVVRTATRGITTAPQESIILSPQEAAALRQEVADAPGRLVVVDSPFLTVGTVLEVNGQARIGRGAENTIRLDDDSTVSSRHATIDRRRDGLWIEDSGSTNGTLVNGARVAAPRRLQPGDVVRVGRTDLAVER